MKNSLAQSIKFGLGIMADSALYQAVRYDIDNIDIGLVIFMGVFVSIGLYVLPNRWFKKEDD